jgi:enterochelin esterase family protein
MKSIVFVVLSLSALLTSTAFAQRAATDTGGGVVSPEVHPDRTVTFRLRAPNAADVTLSGDWLASPEKLTKDANGVWCGICRDVWAYRGSSRSHNATRLFPAR